QWAQQTVYRLSQRRAARGSFQCTTGRVFTREALALVADRSLTGVKMAAALTPIVARRGAPTAITVDNGEFVGRARDGWAYTHDVWLEFIRPGKPVENAFIESLNGRSATNASRPRLCVDGRSATRARRLAR